MQWLPISSVLVILVTLLVSLSILTAKSVLIQKESKNELSSCCVQDARGAYENFNVMFGRPAGLIFDVKQLG